MVLGWQEKHRLVLEHARPYGVLVETGLWRGMGASVALSAQLECWAIDLDPANVETASGEGVRALLGDSALVLPRVLRALSGPACFWLDAHLLEGDERWGEVRCPLLDELAALVQWEHGLASTVLVDDVRLFDQPGYPSMDEVRMLAAWPEAWWLDDILRLVPAY